jgi:hypothetical protein
VRGGLDQARFPRWWKMATPGRHAPGVTVGLLRSSTANYPFLVERAFQAGRVMMCAVPLDNSWATNLPDLPAFVPLAHELIYHLAGARSAEFNPRPGQPLRYRVDTIEVNLASFKLQPPNGPARPLGPRSGEKDSYPAQVIRQERSAVVVIDGARETGVYRLETPEGNTVYYSVPPDARESDLTPANEEDRNRVAGIIKGIKYENERGAIVQVWISTEHRQDFWMYFLLGLVALLCLEVWMTRRMVKGRAA